MHMYINYEVSMFRPVARRKCAHTIQLLTHNGQSMIVKALWLINEVRQKKKKSRKGDI